METLVYFLGPHKTYSELAARKFASKLHKHEKAILVPASCMEDIVHRVVNERARKKFGIIPYYNFLEGLEQESLDIIYSSETYIIGAERVAVEFSLGIYPGGKVSEVHNVVYSHHKALAQCSSFLYKEFPKVQRIATLSTSEAIERVSQIKCAMAIGREDALKDKGLEVIARDISDSRHGQKNFTDFYVISNEKPVKFNPHKKNYLSMVAITPYEDKAGLLASILSIVADHGLNNAKIHSRPALHITDPVVNNGNGEPQMFYLEIASHCHCADFKKCLQEIERTLANQKDIETVRALGTYKRPSL